MSAAPAPEGARSRRAPDTHRARALGWAASLVLVAGLAWLVAQRGEVARLFSLLRRARGEWVVLALAAQAGTYACAAAVWQGALAAQGVRRPFASLLPLGPAKLFVDQALPSAGVSGSLLVARTLSRRGVPSAVALEAVVIGLVAFSFASAAVVAAALAAFWMQRELDRRILSLAVPVLLLAALLPVLLLWLQPSRRIPALLRRFPPVAQALEQASRGRSWLVRAPRVLAGATALQVAIFVLDCVTLAASLRAVGSHAPPAAVYTSFVTATVVAAFTLLPGGIGSFDATCVAMLHAAGVTVGEGVAALVLYRGFTLLMPLPAGWWIVSREVR